LRRWRLAWFWWSAPEDPRRQRLPKRGRSITKARDFETANRQFKEAYLSVKQLALSRHMSRRLKRPLGKRDIEELRA
jgi:hypothetical protein